MSDSFVIYAPPFQENSGGIVVLHKLKDTLVSLGKECSLVVFGQSVDVEDAVVVYPEIVSGNPLKAKKVVRWVLNTPGKIGSSTESTWGQDDIVFLFSDNFTCTKQHAGVLRVMDFRFDLFHNKRLDRDIDCCVLFYKQSSVRNEDVEKISNSNKTLLRLDDYISDLTSVSIILNRCRKFYSFDTNSYYNVAAALCGCDTIIIPSDSKSKEDWIKNEPCYKYGISYGFEDSSPLVDSDVVVDHLKNLESENLISVKQFIDIANG
jgi:hypothetical protein